MKKFVLAISGGVDSVVLLDMIVKGLLPDIRTDKNNLLVAHFDHGIRENSANDSEFVQKLTEKYGLQFYLGKGDLSKDASENLARVKRYEFLRQVADDGMIVAAHHQDDLIETILINLIRGTGWRGLAPFWSDDIKRPLLNKNKAEIVEYAVKNNLDWVEDETNYSSKYFRNRVRDVLVRITKEQKAQLIEIYKNQAQLRTEIEKIIEGLICEVMTAKNITSLPEIVATELLRKLTDGRLTAVQLRHLLTELRNVKSGDILQPGGGVTIGIYHDVLSFSNS